MSKRVRTEITIETERTVTINVLHASFVAWCEECAAQVPTVTLRQATTLLKLSAAAMQQLLQSQQLHLIERGEDLLFVCLVSLYRRH